MRKVDRDYKDKPTSLDGSDFETEWNRVARQEERKIKGSIYSDPYYDANGKTASRVIDKLNTWYHYKCAYCERRYKLDVEHYRPKGEVRDLENNKVQINNGKGVLVDHPGYYWLCYEWSNLLPACISCNRDGGKYSKFPTFDHYNGIVPLKENKLIIERCFVGHKDLNNEMPYLIHPENDEVKGKFKFKVDNEKKGIEILGADPEGRGEATINICQLNRPEIRMDRLEFVIDPINKALLSIIKRFDAGKFDENSLKSRIDDLIQKLYDDLDYEELSHTYLRGYILENETNFEEIVIPFISPKMQKILIEAFRNYTPT
jgi:hypothetical protein